MILNTLLVILLILVGFTIGRLSDKWGGHLNAPHHWIWGVVIIIIGLFWIHWTIPFGIGLFVSDLNDFLKLKFWSTDKPKEWKFWDID